MDAIDYKILKILQKNARETASNISKEIHLSVSAVIERIRKMEETGVIKEYTIIIDEKKTGNETLEKRKNYTPIMRHERRLAEWGHGRGASLPPSDGHRA